MQRSPEKTLIEDIQQQLSARFGKDVVIKSISGIGGGCINNASKLVTSEGDFFMKWNKRCAPGLFTREAESLAELSSVKNPYLSIPETLAVKEVGDSPGFIVLEYLEPGYVSGNAEENLGRGLATIHKKTNNNFGFYHNNYCGSTIQDNRWNSSWVDFFGQQRIWQLVGLIRQEKGLPPEHVRVYERLVAKLPELLPSESRPALIHGDLWSGNYMYTNSGPALIDPASYYADREMEMGIMTMFGGFSSRFWSAYNEIYPLPIDWRERNMLYQLYHILNHYYLFGGGYGSQAIGVAKQYA